MNRCQCWTLKGKQCSRDAKEGSIYCFQHQECKNKGTGQKKITIKKKSPTTKIMKINKPKYLLKEFGETDLTQLAQNKDKPYDKFIDKLSKLDKIPIKNYNKMVYTPQNITIELRPELSKIYYSDDKPYVPKIIKLQNNKGFTAGQLLYEIAKALPEEEDLYETYQEWPVFTELTLDEKNDLYHFDRDWD